MSELFAVYETARLGCARFGAAHCLWLSIAVVFWTVAMVRYRSSDAQGRQRWRWTLALLLMLDEAGKYVVVIAAGFPSAQYLPLHLCSIGVFASIRFAVAADAASGAFLCLSLPGAVGALILPGWLSLPAGSLLSMHSFSFHILLVASALLPLCSGEIHARFADYFRALEMLFVMCGLLHVVNRFYKTDFFFMETILSLRR